MEKTRRLRRTTHPLPFESLERPYLDVGNDHVRWHADCSLEGWMGVMFSQRAGSQTESETSRSREGGIPAWLFPAIGTWSLLMTAEVIHGTLRVLFVEPVVGEFRARQLGVVTGSVLVLAITYALVRFLRANRPAQWIAIGLLWLGLTLAFELVLGRYAFGFGWDRLLADYDLSAGGLMPLGLAVLTLAPWLTGWLRGLEVREPPSPRRRKDQGTI